MHRIRTKKEPNVVKEVSDGAYQDLKRWCLLLEDEVAPESGPEPDPESEQDPWELPQPELPEGEMPEPEFFHETSGRKKRTRKTSVEDHNGTDEDV